MNWLKGIVAAVLCVSVLASVGCRDKTKRKYKVEGPDRKTEVKVESTDKD